LPPPPPIPGADAGPTRFAFDFDDAGLPELVRLLGAITGKRFILTGKLPTVHATVRSPEPVTAAEAYDAFLAILQENGLTVVQSGRFWKILPSPGVPPEHAGGA
jgi:general secretion pathway protein D